MLGIFADTVTSVTSLVGVGDSSFRSEVYRTQSGGMITSVYPLLIFVASRVKFGPHCTAPVSARKLNIRNAVASACFLAIAF